VWARGLTGVDVWLDCKRGSKSTGRNGSRGRCRTNARAAGVFAERMQEQHLWVFGERIW
jgi:hypothetical protein